MLICSCRTIWKCGYHQMKTRVQTKEIGACAISCPYGVCYKNITVIWLITSCTMFKSSKQCFSYGFDYTSQIFRIYLIEKCTTSCSDDLDSYQMNLVNNSELGILFHICNCYLATKCLYWIIQMQISTRPYHLKLGDWRMENGAGYLSREKTPKPEST